MFTTCIDQVDQKVADPWAVEACVIGATCFGGQRPVDDFLAAVYAVKTGSSSTPPASVNEPRLSTSLFDTISTDGKTWTQQNFVRFLHNLRRGLIVNAFLSDRRLLRYIVERRWALPGQRGPSDQRFRAYPRLDGVLPWYWNSLYERGRLRELFSRLSRALG